MAGVEPTLGVYNVIGLLSLPVPFIPHYYGMKPSDFEPKNHSPGITRTQHLPYILHDPIIELPIPGVWALNIFPQVGFKNRLASRAPVYFLGLTLE